MNEITDDLSDIPEEHHDLFKGIRDTIQSLIDERKLKWLADTTEFSEGVQVGLEIAALYGDKLHELYEKSTADSDISDS